jgi:hypothetical protein
LIIDVVEDVRNLEIQRLWVVASNIESWKKVLLEAWPGVGFSVPDDDDDDD